MAAMSIQVPDELRSRLEARAVQGGFDSVESYVEAMLRADAIAGSGVGDEQVEPLLLDRLDGPFVDADAADFEQMRRKLAERLKGIDVPPEPRR
jgi:hypothetical protein